MSESALTKDCWYTCAAATVLLWGTLATLQVLRTGWQPMPFGNEMHYLGLASQVADPRWQEHDFAFGGRSVPLHHVFAYLGGLVTWVSSAYVFGAVCRVVNLLLFTGSFLLLARVLGLRFLGTVVAFLLFALVTLLPIFRMAQFGMMYTTAEPHNTSTALVLIGYALALKGRWYWGTAMLGLATAFHASVGPLCSFPFLLTALVQNRRARKPLWTSGGLLLLWGVLAAPGVVPQALSTLSNMRGPELAQIVFERGGHHVDWTRFADRLAFGFVILGLALFLNWRRENRGPGPDLLTVTFLVSGGLWLLAVAERLVNLSYLAVFIPFRSWQLVLILFCMLVPGALARLSWYQAVSERVQVWLRRPAFLGPALLVLCVALALAAPGYRWLEQLRAGPTATAEKAQKQGEREDVYRWVRENTSAEARFLVSPEFWWEPFHWRTERGLVFHEKIMPHEAGDMFEWKRRRDKLIDVFETQWGKPAFRRGLAEVVDDLKPDYVICRPFPVVASSESAVLSERLQVVYQNDSYVVFARRTAARSGWDHTRRSQ
jgi:hypothetical protein